MSRPGRIWRRCIAAAPRAAGLNQAHRLSQRLRGIEWQWRIDPSPALPHFSMAAGAVAGVHSRGMGLVARLTTLRHSAVRRAHMKRHVSPVGMAVRLGAGLQRILGSHIGMRVVAHATASAVRVLIRIEGRQQPAHLMAAKTLPLTGSQGAGSGVQRHELSLRRELMAGITVELLLVREGGAGRLFEPGCHTSQLDLSPRP